MRVIWWLTTMNVLWVSEGKLEGELTPEKKKEYSKANTIFCGAVVRILAETLQAMYLHYKTAKEMWDTLNIIEQYHDYQMLDGKSVVTQDHEIQLFVKELRLLKIVVHDEFVAGALLPNCLLHGWILPLFSNTRGYTCLF
jgi:hypothetical protein